MARKAKRDVAPTGRGGFPARAVLVDANVLIRFHKCDRLDLQLPIKLVVADRVHDEFSKGGPSERAALKRLEVARHSIRTDSAEWNHLSNIRHRFGTKNIGEDASIAIALAQADRGHVVPFVVYDDRATKKARELDVATVSFLETLAWLTTCGVLSLDEAETIEQRAATLDGWKRPRTQSAPLADQIAALTGALAPQVEAARSQARKKRRR